jgi:endonuclease YncB( thermonuclease family)
VSTPSRWTPWFGRHRALTAIVALVLVSGVANLDSDEQPLPPGGSETAATTSARPDEPSQSGTGRKQAKERNAEGGDRASSAPRQRRAKPRAAKPKPAGRIAWVTRVIDGDTVELGNGESVRLVGIDTPEVGECGYERASQNLERLVLGKQVRLVRSDEDRDGYGRLLRYVDVGPMDAGLRLVKNGVAIARYDSRDGYGYHPREPSYIAADRGAAPVACRAVPLVRQPATGGAGCAPGYRPCVPPYGPDVDCADLDGPVHVTGTDPHALDADGDGVACE